MTDEELDAIEARANAATPGPWTWETDYEEEGGYFLDGSDGEDVGWARSEPDIVFITAARVDVPALVAEVRRLRAVERAAHEVVAVVLGNGKIYDDDPLIDRLFWVLKGHADE